MHSLFDPTLTHADLVGSLGREQALSALPRAGAPEWHQAATRPVLVSWIAAIRRRAEDAALRPMPELTDELYALYWKTGERLAFENLYFERRRLLSRSALAILLGPSPQTDPLLPDLIGKMRDVMREESWPFPSHVNTPSGKDSMAIDLFGAETANLLAELCRVFSDLLPAELLEAVRSRLRREYFENFLENHQRFHWSWWSSNWNAVCHQGVVGAALTLEDDADLVARLLMLAREGLPNFLAGFGADGSTSEGPGYWQYGFGWFTELNAQLEARSAGRLSLFEGNQKIRRIAAFGPSLLLRNGYWINFSDNGPRGVLRPALLEYLGRRLGEQHFHQAARSAYRDFAANGIDLDHQRSDFFHFSRMALRCPENIEVENEAEPEDIFFPDYGAIMTRGTDLQGHYWEFAAKAGHNDEHHNHNDCGSFLLHGDGAPAIIEIGAPEYVADFFGEKRYTFLAARASGHSVPLVNGFEQHAGRTFEARVLEHRLTPSEVRFQIDLTKCYPAEALCRRLIRTFVFEKEKGVLLVSDHCDLQGPGTLESLVVCHEATLVESGRARIGCGNGGILLEGLHGTRIDRLDRQEYRLHTGGQAFIQRLHLVPERAGESLSISCRIWFAPAV